MRSFAQKPKVTQQTKSAEIMKPNLRLSGQSRDVRSTLHLLRTVGNQAVQRLLPDKTEDLEASSDSSASSGFGHDFSQISIFSPSPVQVQPKLTVNTPGDLFEQEADRVAQQVIRMPEPQLQRACPCGGGCPKCQTEQPDQEHERLQTKRVGSSDTGQTAVPPIVHEVLAAPGQPLDSGTRGFMEPRFSYDFSGVRVHANARADAASAAVGARAFTVGANVVFRRGQFAPHTQPGRALLAHELTHVVQQGAAGRIKGPREEVGGAAAREARVNGRKGADPVHTGGTPIRHVAHAEQVQREIPAATELADPLCSDYVYFIEKTIIEGQINDLKATPDVEKRLDLIRELKWIWRCSTEAEKSEIKTKLKTDLGEKEAVEIWKEAGTPFGGYRGAYPGYYPGGKGRLKRLGVSEIEAYGAFAYDPRSSADATFITGRETTATTEAPVLTATDLLYFYGHQYAQYNSPGVFANGIQTQFIDLRALAGKGDFSRVKLIVSTSCATCCKEAVETFAPIFPNAVILGYRKSSPKEGEVVRNDFDKSIRALKRPLLLDEPVDVNAIIGVWKSVVERHHPNENTRLPGYYQGGTVHYLELGTWKSMPATDAGNTCRKKGTTIEEATH